MSSSNVVPQALPSLTVTRVGDDDLNPLDGPVEDVDGTAWPFDLLRSPGERSPAAYGDAARSAARPGPSPVRRLGRYILLEALGRGGMGTVVKALDTSLNRKLAVKLLHPDLTERDARRMVREARSLAMLSHPNVVQVYEVGTASDQVFIAMELVEGQTLSAWSKRCPRTWKECIQVYQQAGQGLAAAHAAGLVHRDFKPSNCIIDPEQRVKVLDFGLAQAVAVPEPPSQEQRSPLDLPLSDSLGDITRPGAVLGTLAYMSPEQMMGRPLDPRTDQFSFCVALYEALYAEHPFGAHSLWQLAAALRDGRVRPPPPDTRVPSKLRRLLLRGLAKRPEHRWPSMNALLAELRRFSQPRRAPAHRLGWMSAGLLGLGLGALSWFHPAWAEPCANAQDHLREVWDEERKQQIKDSLLASEAPYAAQTWARVESRLDGYAQSWVDRHTDVCRATAVTQEQSTEVMDLRMACLEERRHALRSVVDVLGTGDPKIVRTAVVLVANLPRLMCNDVDQLRTRLHLPEDPQQAEQVSALREMLLEANIARQAGHIDPSFATITAVIEQANAVGYRPLQAEALLHRGMIHLSSGRYTEAYDDLHHAYTQGLELGHDIVVLRSAIKLTHLVGHTLSRHEQGLQWGETALALARRHTDRAMFGSALNVVGTIHQSKGNYAQAEHYYRQALEQWLDTRGPEHPLVGHALNSLGNVLNETGQYEQAEIYFERTLRTWEQALGSEHPLVADSLTNLGNVYINQRRYDEAQASVQRAQEIREHTLRPEHPRMAIGLNSLGQIYTLQDEPTRAIRYCERALQIWEQALGIDHPNVAYALYNIGMAYIKQHDHAQATHYMDRALHIWEKAKGSEHPLLAHPLIGLARSALAQRQPDLARDYAERALSIREANADATPPKQLASVRFVLAQAVWPDQGVRAHDLAQHALDDYGAQGANWSDKRDEVQRWIDAHPLSAPPQSPAP
ncbi:MAG: serine/threonine-protein kinase [Myxococcota bacterium]